MPAKKTATASRYQPHPMLALEAKAMQSLEDDTGKSWNQWLALARRKGPKERRPLKVWLQEQGLTNMRAHWVAAAALEPDAPSYDDPEPLVDGLYSGSKAALRPLHESIVDVALALGTDVIVTSCKTNVPIYRKHAFASLRPVDGCVEVQLALGEVPAAGRLERAEGRNAGDRMSHAVRVRSGRDVDAALRSWMKQAYELGAAKIARKTAADLPADLAKPLKSSKPAQATWATCTDAMKRDLIDWITSAKKDETRAKRVGMVVDALAAGKRRVY